MKRLLLLCALAATRADAHDLWIEPSTFRPAAGGLVTVSLRVGQKLVGEPLPRIPQLVDRFVLGDAPMIGMTGRVAAAGPQWIGYQSNAYPVTLDAAKFEAYLREEGLERVIDLRAERGQSAAPGRERFYRCAKALIGPGAALPAPLGFTLELIPQATPRRGKLPLTLLFRGKPAANVLVVAMSKSDPDNAVRARTDAKGRVTLPIAHDGFWLIKAVHMQAAPAGADVDWESWWASITFEL